MSENVREVDVCIEVIWAGAPKPDPKELERRISLATKLLLEGEGFLTAEARKALQLIKSAAEQSSQWPPHRRDATLDGIEKVAIRALKSPKPPIL